MAKREKLERMAAKALHSKMEKKETAKQHLKRKGGAKMFEHGDDWHN